MQETLEQLLDEQITLLTLKERGLCNNAYYVETVSGRKLMVKQEREDKEFQPQNTLEQEAAVIALLSTLPLREHTPYLSFVSKNPAILGYAYIQGEPLVSVWHHLSKDERRATFTALGVFHAQLGQVTQTAAEDAGISINLSTGLHPETEKELEVIASATEIPASWKELATKARALFNASSHEAVFQFLHNDAHHENILMQDNRISGIIDFGESEFGEVAKEFSRYIRDYPDYAEYSISAYEHASGQQLSRTRLITNSFLSGLIDHVEAYRSGGEHRKRAENAVAWYAKMILGM